MESPRRTRQNCIRFWCDFRQNLANCVLQIKYKPSYQLKHNYIHMNKSGIHFFLLYRCTYISTDYRKSLFDLLAFWKKLCIFLTIKLMPVIKPVNGKNHDNWPSYSKMNKAGTSLWIKKNLRGTLNFTTLPGNT